MIRGGSSGTGFIDIKQRSPPGKTILDSVPMADSRFTELPAKKDNFGPQYAREVNETLLHSLAQATVAMDFSHPLSHFCHEPGDFPILQSMKSAACGSSCSSRVTVSLLLFSRRIFSKMFSTKGRTVGSSALASSTVKSRGKESEATIQRGVQKFGFLGQHVLKEPFCSITSKDPFPSEALAAERYCLNDRSYER